VRQLAEILTKSGIFVAIIALGYMLKRIGVFRKEDFSVISKIVMKVTLPAAIVSSFAGREIDLSMLSLIPLAVLFGILYMLVGAVLNLRKGKEQMSFDMLNLSGYNIGNFTMPFIQYFLSPMSVVACNIFGVGNALICLGGAFGVARMVKSGERFSVKRVLTALGSSVPFLSYVVMTILCLAKIELPAAVVGFADTIGVANPFLAMFLIGVGFHIDVNREQLSKVLRILGLRYGIAVVIALLCWFALPYSLQVRQALLIMVFSPIANAVVSFTDELKGDVGLSSAVNSISILISVAINVVLLSVIL
jgi:predicted permease